MHSYLLLQHFPMACGRLGVLSDLNMAPSTAAAACPTSAPATASLASASASAKSCRVLSLCASPQLVRALRLLQHLCSLEWAAQVSSSTMKIFGCSRHGHQAMASIEWVAHLAGSPVLGITAGCAAVPPLLPEPACECCCAAAACADMPGALPLLCAAALLLVAAPALLARAAHAPSPADFWRLAGGTVSATGACLPELAAGRETCEDSWLNWLDSSPFAASGHKSGRAKLRSLDWCYHHACMGPHVVAAPALLSPLRVSCATASFQVATVAAAATATAALPCFVSLRTFLPAWVSTSNCVVT